MTEGFFPSRCSVGDAPLYSRFGGYATFTPAWLIPPAPLPKTQGAFWLLSLSTGVVFLCLPPAPDFWMSAPGISPPASFFPFRMIRPLWKFLSLQIILSASPPTADRFFSVLHEPPPQPSRIWCLPPSLIVAS